MHLEELLAEVADERSAESLVLLLLEQLEQVDALCVWRKMRNASNDQVHEAHQLLKDDAEMIAVYEMMTQLSARGTQSAYWKTDMGECSGRGRVCPKELR